MLLAAISDLHGYVPSPAVQRQIDAADVICVCGDVQSPNRQSIQWINSLEKPVVFGPGNHDFFAARTDSDSVSNNWGFCSHVRVLIDQSCEINGIRFYGTPWSPLFFDWAFMLPPDGLRTKFSRIPNGIDILLCHSPPLIPDSRIDVCVGQDKHLGSPELTDAVRRAAPRFLFCGHIHTGDHAPAFIGRTACHNVSYLNEQYRPEFGPTLVKI